MVTWVPGGYRSSATWWPVNGPPGMTMRPCQGARDLRGASVPRRAGVWVATLVPGVSWLIAVAGLGGGDYCGHVLADEVESFFAGESGFDVAGEHFVEFSCALGHECHWVFRSVGHVSSGNSESCPSVMGGGLGTWSALGEAGVVACKKTQPGEA